MGIIGSIMSLPYMILFFALWKMASLIRPVLVICLICLLANPQATRRKLQLFFESIRYLVLCNDKKWKIPSDDYLDLFKVEGAKIDSKTVIFVRHGESMWNYAFNKGDRSTLSFILNFVPILIQAIFTEIYFFVSGKADESWLYDSPLSAKGIQQALNLQTFLRETKLEHCLPKEAQLLEIMLGKAKNGEGPSSQLVSSNLRRAIATVAIAVIDRLDENKEKDRILILPQLQEISRNPDALSITSPKGKVPPAWTDPSYLEEVYANQVDTSLQTGNKPIHSTGLDRMQEFCRIAFHEVHKESLIVGGHSLWFRSFFQTYLPRSFEHVAKKKKLINGGCVGFTLQRLTRETGEEFYRIDPKSILVLYGGF